ncbi:MAG: hypothetical protein IPK58_22170 [Acidobacteria bacterium]|nr:hypothetical protein [Acidobacteriota bacterium]
MSKKRYVDTKFWDDNFIIGLDPIEKLLFLYFLTNPLTELSGAYEISLRRVAFDTGIDRDMVLKILERFEKHNKMIFREGWVFIVNFMDYQAINPKIKLGIERSFKCCPDWIKDRLSKPIEAYQSLSHSDLDFNSDFNSDSDSNFDSNFDLNLKVSDEKEKPAKPKPVRGTRIPDPFLLTADMREWATERVPNIDLTTETEKFVNYYRALAGAKATKIDWIATWRNWMLNAKEWTTNGQHTKLSAKTTEYRDKRTVEAERLQANYALVAKLRAIGDAEDAARRERALLGNGNGLDNQIGGTGKPPTTG